MLRVTVKLAQVTLILFLEVRIGFLAYQIQRIGRNKQITAMLIYMSMAINLFIRMLYFIYKKRGDYDGLPDIKAEKEKSSPEEPKVSSSPSKIEKEIKV